MKNDVGEWLEPSLEPWFFDNEERYDCPRRPWLDDPASMGFLYDAYAHYTNGFLLEEGAILDQNPKLMKLLAIMSSEMLRCEEERRDTDRQRAEHRRSAEQMARERHGGGG